MIPEKLKSLLGILGAEFEGSKVRLPIDSSLSLDIEFSPPERPEWADILGIEDWEGAGEEEVRAAHRAMMKKEHPDRGGCPKNAVRINQALHSALNDIRSPKHG